MYKPYQGVAWWRSVAWEYSKVLMWCEIHFRGIFISCSITSWKYRFYWFLGQYIFFIFSVKLRTSVSASTWLRACLYMYTPSANRSGAWFPVLITLKLHVVVGAKKQAQVLLNSLRASSGLKFVHVENVFHAAKCNYAIRHTLFLAVIGC